MGNNEICIKGSFYGIRGELLKRVTLLIIYSFIFLFTKNYKDQFYSTNKISTLTKFLSDKFVSLDFMKLAPLIIVAIVLIILFFLTISSLFKTIKLLYFLKRKITFDFFQGKITMVTYSFPFFKHTEEDKFENIVTVNVEQSLLDRFFNSGKLYIEYLVSGRVEPTSLSIEIPQVYRPSRILKELIK